MYEYDGISMFLKFIPDEEDGVVLLNYRWRETDSSVKDAITAWFAEEYGLEYFTDYTISAYNTVATTNNRYGGELLVFFRDLEVYTMIKLTSA